MRVGVIENLFLVAALMSVTEKEGKKNSSLAIDLAEVGSNVGPKTDNVMDMLNEASDSSGENSTNRITLFPPSVIYLGDDTKEDKFKKGDKRPGEDIFADFVTLKNQCTHLLSPYLKPSEIKWDLLKGINLAGKSNADIQAAFQKENIRDHVFKNLCDQFAAMIAPFLGKEDRAIRLLLVRSSSSNHFGKLRDRYLEKNPVIESMNVSIPESKLYVKEGRGTTKLHEPIEVNGVKFVPAFNAWEIDNGRDDASKIDEDGDGVDNGVDMNAAEEGLNPELFSVEDSEGNSVEGEISLG